MKILSVDIGDKNFAYSVCILEQSNLKILSTVLVNVKPTKKKDQTLINTCLMLTKLFEDSDLASCDLVVIEQQVRGNVKAQKLAQHVWSYFHTKFLNTNKQVVNVPASLKTQTILGNNSLCYNDRKKWSVSVVTTKQLITKAAEAGLKVVVVEEVYQQIESLKKKDDVCDTIVQAVAYIINKML